MSPTSVRNLPMRPRLVGAVPIGHRRVVVQEFTHMKGIAAACLSLSKVTQDYGHWYRTIPILPTDKSENLG